jgi:hypothetical protein
MLGQPGVRTNWLNLHQSSSEKKASDSKKKQRSQRTMREFGTSLLLKFAGCGKANTKLRGELLAAKNKQVAKQLAITVQCSKSRHQW